jgi:hypothetical protein
MILPFLYLFLRWWPNINPVLLWMLGLIPGVPLILVAFTFLCSFDEPLWGYVRIPSFCSMKTSRPPKTSAHQSDTHHYFSEEWAIQAPRFGWESRSDTMQLADSFVTSKLCGKCLEVVGKSGLISGSKEIVAPSLDLHNLHVSLQESRPISALKVVLTPSLEWHNWHMSLRELQVSKDEHCHLCTIFWCSIPENKRQNIEEVDNQLRTELDLSENNQLDIDNLSCVKRRDEIIETLQLKVKIWESRSEGCRYMQLYRNQNELCLQLQIREGNAQYLQQLL